MTRSALQDWVMELPIMQQSVLLSAIRGHDGFAKHHPSKPMIRWLRRSILISAFDGCALDDPNAPGGGSFTGPLERPVQEAVNDFMGCRDEFSLHYWLHVLHATQIVGLRHASEAQRRDWAAVYTRMVDAMHLRPEPEDSLNARLSDNKAAWIAGSIETLIGAE